MSVLLHTWNFWHSTKRQVLFSYTINPYKQITLKNYLLIHKAELPVALKFDLISLPKVNDFFFNLPKPYFVCSLKIFSKIMDLLGPL